MEFRHTSVLTGEVVALLAPREGALILDGTLGAGGHAEALLERGATVLGLDRDPQALAASRARLARFGSRFSAEQARFSQAPALLERRGVDGVDGLLLDLGVSSPQLDDPARGFSFQQEGPLDMRMGAEGETAAQLIARLDARELETLLRELGEEPFARRVARAIKAAPPPQTTLELASIVGGAIPRKAWPRRIHPATRTFQALRLAVNQELEELDLVLEALPSLLRPGGRAAIISFHSLEDRRVKRAFRDLVGRCRCPPGLPVCGCGAQADFQLLTPKAITASPEEEARNPRARSARLRGLRRLR